MCVLVAQGEADRSQRDLAKQAELFHSCLIPQVKEKLMNVC